MHLEYFNCPEPGELNPDTLPTAEFLSYVPDFEQMKTVAEPYRDYKNLLVIGNGGSISSFISLYSALKQNSTKQAYILNTVDPDYIYELKQQLSPKDTVVVALSKSGENTTQMESSLHFLDYPMVFLANESSPLSAVADKLKKPIIYSPPIGDRFAGAAETALLPLLICGLDVEKIFLGARNFREEYKSDNLAWKAASILWQLERNGYTNVFVPVYSHNLAASGHLISQLCHESFGKDGKGQTYVVVEGPEWQHHASQRFYGGPKNSAGFFVTTDNFIHPADTVVPPQLHRVQFKNHHLVELDKIPLDKALSFEWQANLDDTKRQNIPALHLNINGFHEQELGHFLAFWQLYAVYGSVLRGVNPFDQPAVEASKVMSFDKRLQFKGLL